MTLNEYNKLAVFLETCYEIEIGKFDISNIAVLQDSLRYYINIYGEKAIFSLNREPIIEIIVDKEYIKAFFEDGR